MFLITDAVGHFVCAPECSLTQADALIKEISLPFRSQVSLWKEKGKIHVLPFNQVYMVWN